MNFKKIKEKIYYKDVGTLRDICTNNIDNSDWYKILIFLENSYKYTINDKKISLDKAINLVSSYFESNFKGETVVLKIYIDKIQVNGFFMIGAGDFLDIEPNEIKTIDDHNKLVNFLKKLSSHLGKNIYISPENSPKEVLFKI